MNTDKRADDSKQKYILHCTDYFSQRRIEELLSKQKEVNDQLNMAEDDVAQVNDVLTMLHDSKEVRTSTNTDYSSSNSAWCPIGFG